MSKAAFWRRAGLRSAHPVPANPALALMVCGALACGQPTGTGSDDVLSSDGAGGTDMGNESDVRTGGPDVLVDAHADGTGTDVHPDVHADAHVDSPVGPTDVSPRDATPPADVGSQDSGSRCGTCPTGFSCGASGYCVSPNGVPAFGHVYLIMMENTSLSTLMPSTGPERRSSVSERPHEHLVVRDRLRDTPVVRGAYSHPSCPNYLSITAGTRLWCQHVIAFRLALSLTTEGECLLGDSNHSNGLCPQNPPSHLGDVLDTAGVPWRQYAEGMGTPCNTSDTGNYVVRHVPFLYYDNVRTDATRCNARVVDYSNFANDFGGGHIPLLDDRPRPLRRHARQPDQRYLRQLHRLDHSSNRLFERRELRRYVGLSELNNIITSSTFGPTRRSVRFMGRRKTGARALTRYR